MRLICITFVNITLVWGSNTAEKSADALIRDQLVSEALEDAGTEHLDAVSQDISLGGSIGDYSYVDRSFGGAVLYDADGGTSNIDFVGNENTFILDASSDSLISLVLVTIQE